MIAFPRLRRASGVVPAVVLAAAMLIGLGQPAARAQGFGWFGGLLGGGTPQRSPAPAYPGYDSGGSDSDRGYKERRRKAQRHKKSSSDQAQSSEKPVPKNATVFVGVFGDSLGVFLANGLDEALADRTEVGVLHKARGSTGLVTESFYNWPKTIDELLARQGKGAKTAERSDKPEKDQADKGKETAKDTVKDTGKGSSKDSAKDKAKTAEPEKIDVAVMMIGSNDRQPITEGGKTYPRGSEEWTAIYRKRVTAIAEAFQKRKIPLVWVGIPITKEEGFADDMAALNEIYRDVAAKTGATYVDTWEAFSDDAGKFAASGPDVNGQMTRLRSGDGIHFTAAGARKLAHFVETPVRRDLDGKAPLPQLPTAEAPSDGKKVEKGKDGKEKDGKTVKPAVAVAKPDAGPITNLGEAPSAKDGQLASAPRPKEPEPGDSAAEATPVTRADNFRWSGGALPQP